MTETAFAEQNSRMVAQLHEDGLIRRFLLSMQKTGRLVNAATGDVKQILEQTVAPDSEAASRIPRVVLRISKGEAVCFVGDLFHAGGRWGGLETNVRLHAYIRHKTHRVNVGGTNSVTAGLQPFLERETREQRQFAEEEHKAQLQRRSSRV